MREEIRRRAAVLDNFPGSSLPKATPEIIARAERIALGTIFFYDRTPVEIGLHEIDWSGGHLAHQEWPAQLNRFGYLRHLATAYLHTKGENYARAARAYIEDWFASENYDALDRYRPGDSGLNMSIRLGTSQHSGWGGTLPAFLDSASFDDEFLTRLLASIGRQARFLSQHLTAWGNWRISELDALVFTALRFPFLEEMDSLLSFGITGMRNALATQFLPDGVHIERTPGYATWMTHVAASYYELAQHFPEVDAHVDPIIVSSALNYIAQSALAGMNDAGVKPHDPEHITELDLRRSLLTRLFPEHKSIHTPPLDQVFSDAGQVFSRTGWTPGAQALAFDAGTWGGGHGHLSRLSLSFRAMGRLLVADPGILNYEMSDPLGPYGKSTRAHSTLCINGCNQSPTDATLHQVAFTPETALIHAEYQGSYWEGDYSWSFHNGLKGGTYGRHERLLFWVKDEYLIVLDRMESDPGTTVHNCWQLGPMEGWEHDPAHRAWWSKNREANLFLQLVYGPQAAIMECFEGSRDPLRGWIGAHGNDAIPAPLVEFRYPGTLRGVTTAAFLVPFLGAAVPSYTVQSQSDNLLVITTPTGTVDYLAWTPRLDAPIEYDFLMTDSPFLWLRTDASGAPTKGYLLRGSYLQYHARRLHDAPIREAVLLNFSEE